MTAVKPSSGFKICVPKAEDEWRGCGAILLPLDLDLALHQGLAGALVGLPDELAEACKSWAERRHFRVKAKTVLSFDLSSGERVVAFWYSHADVAFTRLGMARKLLTPLTELQSSQVWIELRHFAEPLSALVDSLVSAAVTLEFKFQKYAAKTITADSEESPAAPLQLKIATTAAQVAELKSAALLAQQESLGTNFVRALTMRAANDLVPKTYIAELKALAAAEKLSFTHYSIADLKTMAAGAFLAVTAADPEAEGGIVHLRYEPEGNATKAEPGLILVGKGVTFDTGGFSLKSAKYMYTMHTDMAGSAVAAALIHIAAREKWPIRVDAWLAIAENLIGPRGIKPNEVVTSLQGDTIEMVNTDAEGRMLLADTLHLASRDGGALLLDFATLTGACVAALGSTYAGVFTPQADLVPQLVAAGIESGERVWAMPMDEDFAECLDSDIADTLQCRVSGGVDHIEAALFLKRFVKAALPWVHFDLSAAHHEGGLAHVSTTVTGFGVRVAHRFIRKFFAWT